MPDRGFGFIEKSHGADIFARITKVTNGGADDMIPGTVLTYDIVKDARSGRSSASNVSITGSQIDLEFGFFVECSVI